MTERQERFCEYYSIGHRLLKKVEIQEYIAKDLKNKQFKNQLL